MVKKVLIVGNPNSGKSILFNLLNKAFSLKGNSTYSIVANYPYTTVEILRTTLMIDNEQIELLDTPGLNSLSATSEDELSTRDLIIKEKADIIIQAVNSNKLEKSLFLTSQLLELNIPLILVLNFSDETHYVDSKQLENLLAVPTVESIATKGQGFDELVEKLKHLLKNPSSQKISIKYKEIINRGLKIIESFFPLNPLPRALQLLLLVEDKNVELLIKDKYGEDIGNKIKGSLQTFKKDNNIPNLITLDRLEWTENIVENIIKESRPSFNNIQEKIGRYCRHPIWGWPILGLIMYITYLLVGRLAANTLVGLLENNIFHPLYEVIEINISNQLIKDFLVGEYGILSTGLGNALATALPILCMFFLILNIMEDSGYFTNLCILVSRFTKKLGLSGQSILPLMLAFGCKTMATLTTKILDSKKERYIAIFLIAFAIPCSPQMGLILGILASRSFTAFLAVFGSLIVVEFCAGMILNKILKNDIRTDFILEIPPIRVPNIKDLFIKLYFRMKWFMTEIPPLFMIGAFLLFLLDKTDALLVIKQGLTPIIVSFLSLPIETVDAFLLCLVKHEAGAVQLLNLAASNSLSYIQVIVSLILITSLGPCFANLMAIIKQIKLKKALVMRVIILLAALLTGGVVNWIFRLGAMI